MQHSLNHPSPKLEATEVSKSRIATGRWI